MTPATPTPEQVLEQATQAVNEMLGGKLWLHVKTGRVYLEYGRNDRIFDTTAGEKLFSGFMGAPLIEATDDIAAGEEFVRYRNVITGEGWARPARLFDDGRFVPLVLAHPAALAEAQEREARLRELAEKWRAEADFFGGTEDFASGWMHATCTALRASADELEQALKGATNDE